MKRFFDSLTPRDRRALSYGALLAAGAWLVLRGGPSGIKAHQSLRERTQHAVAQLAAARKLVGEDASIRESLAVRASRLVELAPRLLAGQSTADAGAALAAFVSGTADRARIRIVRSELLPDSSAGPFTRLRLRLQAEGDAEGVGRWIASLENGSVALSLSDLELAAAEPASSPDRPSVLRVLLVVGGWTMAKQAASTE